MLMADPVPGFPLGPTTNPAGGNGDDERLVERCLAHDEEAWRLLLERYAGYIYAVALRGFRLPPDAAEDIFQETVLSLLQHLPEFRGEGPLRAWIGRIAQNACRQHVRRRERRPEAPGGVDASADLLDDAQEEVLQKVEQGLIVRTAVARLSTECREVVDLFFFRDRTYADIAASLRIPPGTVASRIARCLVRLRAMLRESG